MKKIIYLILFTFATSVPSFAQSVTIDPSSTPAKRVEINSGVPNVTGLKLTQAKSLSASNNPVVSTPFADINSAVGLAFDNAGNLYATGFSDNSIHKIAPDGTSTLISSGIFLFNNLHDITLGPDGNLYIANYTGNNVLKMTLSPAITFQVFASGFSNPIGLTFDPAGNMYVSNVATGNISKVSSTGTVISHTWATGFTSPYNLVYSSSANKIYVSNYGANEVAAVSLAGGAKTTFKSGVNFCTGITVDASGNLFVAQATPNKVSKITPAGVMTDYVTTNYPFDVTIDRLGNLYIANQTANTVSKASAKFNTILMVNDGGEVITNNVSSSSNSWIETGDGLKNITQSMVTINSQNSTQTNALFGSNGTGISLQKNWPSIGFNTYRDNANVQRYIGTGFGMVTAVDQVQGAFFWNKMGSGSAGDAVGANEQYIAGLNQSGDFNLIGRLSLGSVSSPNRLSIGPISSPAFVGNDIYIGEGTGLGGGMSFYQSGAQTTGAAKWFSNSNFMLMPAGGGNGRVGIGVFPSTYQLEVNGAIRATEVIVETGWADYVFDENYKLRSIEEMESFIKENKHLPNIPAASEIETKGLKVGEVNKAMMEKIEELALYIIQLKKEIDILKSKN